MNTPANQPLHLTGPALRFFETPGSLQPGPASEGSRSAAEMKPQLTHTEKNTMTSSIRTCLWFRDGRGREAAEFYCSLIPGSRVEKTFSGDSGHGTFSVIDFSL